MPVLTLRLRQVLVKVNPRTRERLAMTTPDQAGITQTRLSGAARKPKKSLPRWVVACKYPDHRISGRPFRRARSSPSSLQFVSLAIFESLSPAALRALQSRRVWPFTSTFDPCRFCTRLLRLPEAFFDAVVLALIL